MAYEGELVKMENGRWARFQRCTICNAGHQDTGELDLLVAVELDEHYQGLLDAAEHSVESYRQRGIPVQVRLAPDGKGKLKVSVETGATPSVH